MQLQANHHVLTRPAHVSYTAPHYPMGIVLRTPLGVMGAQCRPHHICKTSATDSGAFVPVEWESDAEVHDEESLQRKSVLIQRFKAADTDGCG